MDNLYGDFKPSLNEIENQSNQTANQTDGLGAAAANKPISSFPKTEFKLSPHAPAFVPRFASVAQQMPSYYENNTEYDQNFPGLGNGYQSGGGQMIQQPQGLQEPNFVGASADEGGAVKLPNEMLKEDDYYALNELNNFIENISKNPALYEANVQLETDVLNNWIVEDPDIIMECVVNNIMDQAIMDNNFRYNGVRFCLHLISNLHVNSSKGSFKQVLLQRCKREHSRRDTLSNASDNGLYLRGLTFFIGDLSTRLNESELTLAVPDLLKTLLQNKSSDNVKCCCQILKVGVFMSEMLFEQATQCVRSKKTESKICHNLNFSLLFPRLFDAALRQAHVRIPDEQWFVAGDRRANRRASGAGRQSGNGELG